MRLVLMSKLVKLLLLVCVILALIYLGVLLTRTAGQLSDDQPLHSPLVAPTRVGDSLSPPFPSPASILSILKLPIPTLGSKPPPPPVPPILSPRERISIISTLPSPFGVIDPLIGVWEEAFGYGTHYPNLHEHVWGITSMFNVERRTLFAYRAWYASVRRQGLPVLLVHAVREGEAPFAELEATLVIKHVVGATAVVSKESLLNVALANLPKSCTKVIWIDADTVLSNAAWVHQTAFALDAHPVVQPFAFYTRLPPGATEIDDMTSLFMVDDAFHPAGVYHSVPLALAFHQYNTSILTLHSRMGHTGGVWAARRSILDDVKFFEGFIMGGGDWATVGAFCGLPAGVLPLLGEATTNGQPVLETWDRYARYVNRTYELVRCDIGVVPGIAGHIWHGPLGSRKYGNRYQRLVDLHIELFQLNGSRSPVWEMAMDTPGSALAERVAPLVAGHHAGKYSGQLDLASFWTPHRFLHRWIHQMWESYQQNAMEYGLPQPREDPSGAGVEEEEKEETSPRLNCSDCFCGVTYFFNALRTPLVVERFRKFRESSKRQGLFLVTVEVVFDAHPIEVKELTDLHFVIIKSTDQERLSQPDGRLFHKEYLINYGLQRLPESCEYVAWFFDNDLMFTNDRWIDETVEMLQTHRLVQPFAMAVRMPCGVDSLDPKTMYLWIEATDRPIAVHHGAGFGLSIRPIKLNRMDYSICTDSYMRGLAGVAWAARVQDIKTAGGIFDFIVGSGSDTLMLFSSISSFCGPIPFSLLVARLPPAVVQEWRRRNESWCRVFCHHPNEIGYADGFVLRPTYWRHAQEPPPIAFAADEMIDSVIHAQWALASPSNESSIEEGGIAGQPPSADDQAEHNLNSTNATSSSSMNSTGMRVTSGANGRLSLSRTTKEIFSIPDEQLLQPKCWALPRYQCRFLCSYRKWLWDEYRVRHLHAHATRLEPREEGDSNPKPDGITAMNTSSSLSSFNRSRFEYASLKPFVIQTRHIRLPYCLSFLARGGAHNFSRFQFVYVKPCARRDITDDLLWAYEPIEGKLVSAFWWSGSFLLKRCLALLAPLPTTAADQVFPVVMPCSLSDVEKVRWDFVEETGQLQVTILQNQLVLFLPAVFQNGAYALSNSSSSGSEGRGGGGGSLENRWIRVFQPTEW